MVAFGNAEFRPGHDLEGRRITEALRRLEFRGVCRLEFFLALDYEASE
jgi:hypothetical protein